MSNHPQQRPDGLTIISIWFYLCGAFFLLVTAIVTFMTLAFGVGAVVEDMGMIIPTAMVGFIALAFMALSILNLMVGYGLWILRPWARIGAIALAIVGLILMPVGTLSGALILWYLLKPESAVAFEKQAAST
jgi:uncharacterized membrane protein (DUF2068 family)